VTDGQQRLERRLAAIFAADVAGYSRLMEQDEVGTLRALTAHREIMDRLIAQHGGRIANTAGDSVLAEFPSAVDAVQCAVEIQKTLAALNQNVVPPRVLRFRIGVHIGDVLIRGGDLLGDGVNIAARLEGLAEPGGICISGDAHRQVRRSLPLSYTDLGPQKVKNIEEPLHAYRVSAVETAFASLEPKPAEAKPLPLPDKPSIAVLPFTNMSGNPEQEYFADGVVEDIITALSRVKWFFVVARNSSFAYKGKALDIRQVGRELGVRYVLEGSIRKGGNRVRITGQLIEAETGHHVWAERYDGDLADIFDLQDEITQKVAGAIEPTLRAAEIARSQRKRPDELGAYDLYLRALPLAYATGREPVGRALELLERAITVDPNYAYTHALASWCYIWHRANAWRRDETQDVRAVEHAKRALLLDPDDPQVLWIAASSYAYIAHDLARASDLIDRSLTLNPNSALGWAMHGWIKNWQGDHATALNSFLKARRLSPIDLMTWFFDAGIGNALTNLERYDEALASLKQAMRANPEWTAGYRGVAACAAYLGRFEEARDAVEHILAGDPTMTVTKWRRLSPLRDSTVLERLLAGLRLAGLPE
jgi:adenylate cyclase